MAMSDYSTAVGVFTDDAQAEQAVNELRRVGFSEDEIRVWKSGEASGGFLENLKSLFTGQKTGFTTGDFTDMGVPEQVASYYQNELAAGRTVVLVRAGTLQKSALEILRQYGGYDAATHQP